ncbi:hypothetical protein BC938DRAFT_477474, partial [Jimgerdemannia flammicorona]
HDLSFVYTNHQSAAKPREVSPVLLEWKSTDRAHENMVQMEVLRHVMQLITTQIEPGSSSPVFQDAWCSAEICLMIFLCYYDEGLKDRTIKTKVKFRYWLTVTRPKAHATPF